ncbi:MAG: LamG domain-containing protein [Bacteroidales bacterium]
MIDYNSLVLWLSNKYGGSYWWDLSKYKNNGRIYGAEVRENALYFNGMNDYVNIPFFDFDIFTITVWVKIKLFEGNSSQFPIYGLYTSYGYVKNYIYINSSGRRTVNFDNFPPGGGSIIGITEINENNWYFIAVVQYANSNRNLYVNCKYEGNSMEIYSGPTPTLTSIGKRFYNTPFYFSGFISEFQIYNRALSENELKILYQLTYRNI